MKIEETPFQVTTLSGGIQKVQRVVGAGPSTNDPEALDLSFMDMLGSMDDEAIASLQTRSATPNGAPEKAKDKPTVNDTQHAEKLKAPEGNNSADSATAANGADVREMVRKELLMLDSDLTKQDMEYLKQVMIPGLPIVVGSVPIEQLFPKGADGDISYRGFDVSKPLSDLIEKGMKTGRPIRVELDNQSSLVLRFKNGRVSAEFLSNDQAAAMHIKQELDELRNRLLAKNLPVGRLEYRHQRQRQQDEFDEQPEES